MITLLILATIPWSQAAITAVVIRAMPDKETTFLLFHDNLPLDFISGFVYSTTTGTELWGSFANKIAHKIILNPWNHISNNLFYSKWQDGKENQFHCLKVNFIMFFIAQTEKILISGESSHSKPLVYIQ